jgi:2,4-dienoyl-CoA reductase-like NADH-dependent reductase (Old Yellow Enzyme family)
VTPAGPAAYPRLFSPFLLGRLRLPNRFTVPALTTNYATPDGYVTDALCTYLAARARGGFGLIVTENLGVHPSGRVMPRMAMIDDDRYVAGLARLAATVKREGGLVVGQLSHAGRQTKSRLTGLPLVAPSAIPCPINRETPRALAVDEILELEQAFVSAAVRLAAAGYDGVEIHGAHGYLVGGFLSRYSNRRDDAFGGALDNRTRFLGDIVDGIQHALGRDFPLLVRLSAREFVPDGLDLPETIEIARRLRGRGVHALSVSVGVYESFNTLSMVSGEPEGQWLPLAGAIRAATGLPTIGVGRVKRARVAEEALASGQIDLAAFGRASIADPDLARKVRDGEESRVLWCFGCNVCLGRTARPETICPVNPAVGREATFAATPAARPVRLGILGASVSALTAAWVAARRGHAVTVYEPAAALVGRATAAGVTVERALPRPEEHDVLWVVRGRASARGHGGAAADRTVTSYDVLASPGDFAGAGRAVVLGDDLASTDAALLLAESGVGVELRSPARDIAVDAHPGYRDVARRELARRGATVVTGARDAPAGAPPLVVVGRDPALLDAGAAGEATELSRGIDGCLDDAYEPGRLTATVYEALARAAALDGPA